jgi:hypothetical protein
MVPNHQLDENYEALVIPGETPCVRRLVKIMFLLPFYKPYTPPYMPLTGERIMMSHRFEKTPKFKNTCHNLKI